MDDDSDEPRARIIANASDAEDSDGEGADLCSAEEPVQRSMGERDWQTIPDVLRCPRAAISTDVFGHDFMRLPEDKVHTMDAVSKCWKTVGVDSPSLLSDETEGGSWVFCEACVAQIPKNLQEILYFFHMLQGSVQDLKYYAVPTRNVVLRKSRGDRKIISDLIWHKPVEQSHFHGVAGGGDELDLNQMMCDRSEGSRQLMSLTVKVAPFKVRLGFTGALYRHNGVDGRKLMAVVVVTWCRNWDMLGYIQDCFLHEPAKKTPNLKQRQQEIKQMRYIWKKMARFVAFDNLGLDETQFGFPEDYSDQPGGKLGVDSLFNMFQIPFQIYGIIKQELLEKLRADSPGATLHDIRLQGLNIVGLPELTFKRDETTADFTKYMHAYVNNLVNERAGFMQALKALNKPKGKKKDDEPEEEEEGEAAAVATLSCPGAWPLASDGEAFTLWGMPRLPLWLEFRPEANPDSAATFENWLADVGGPNGIPELTKTCLRSFLVQDLDATPESIFQTWNHFLRDSRPANPSLVLQEYYGEKADPLNSLVTAGYLRPWWLGVVKDIQAQRERGLSVLHATQSLQRYLLSSSYYHTSSIHSGAFRSARIVQAQSIVEKMDFKRVCVEDTSAEPTCLASFVRFLCKTVAKDRMFDPYQRANEAFWRCLELMNKDFLMNSSNLEFMYEIMVSQLLWMFGPYNETIAAYFQGLHSISGNGHFRVSTKEGIFTDRRKPNSTGMDWTHGRLTELFQMLMDRYGVMDPKQNLQTPLNCMGWTPASIPLLTNASICDGQVESLPDASLGLRSLIATEIRGDGMGVFIKGVFPRNSDGQEQLMVNTCDPEKTNRRKMQIKRKIADLQFCALSTNVSAKNDAENEEYKTLTTVLHVMTPGSGPHTKKQRTGAFNNISCNPFGGRQSKPKRQEAISNLLAYTHVWATCGPALMNKAGVIPAEISPTTLGYLDWLFFYIKESTEGVLDKFVSESFKRMKDGYEARQVAKSLWTQAKKIYQIVFLLAQV
jgi:hypothetical protein